MRSWLKSWLPLSQAGRYFSALLVVTLITALRLALDPILGDRAPYMFYFLAIVMVSRMWGRGPALLATLGGGLAAWYFLITPRFSFTIGDFSDALNLAAYFVTALAFTLLADISTHWPPALTRKDSGIKSRVVRQTAALVAAAVVLVGMVLLLARDVARTQTAEGWVVRTYQVIEAADSVRSSLETMQGSQREFLVTGDERSLESYNAAMATLRTQLDRVRRLTVDNAAQQLRWNKLKRLAEERLELLQQGIDLRRQAGTPAALEFVHYWQGDQAMDTLRGSLESMVAEEQRLLQSRTEEAEVQASRAHWVLGFGTSALVLLLLFANAVIERESLTREKITESLRLHSELLEQAHDSILTFPLGGPIDYWSRGAETLYGYSQEEAIGRISHELLQTDTPLGIAKTFAALERDGRWTGELTQVAKDGRKLTLASRWALVTDKSGRKIVLESNLDTTGRKQAEDDLRRSEWRLRNLGDNLPEGAIYRYRVDKEGSHHVDFISAGIERITGVPAAEYMADGGAVNRNIVLEDRVRLGAAIERSRQELKRFEVEVRHQHRVTGEVRWSLIRSSPTRWEDGSTIWDGIEVDITERKRAEAENLLLATAIEQASETVVVTDREARIQYANPAFTRTTGFSREEALGQNPRVLKSGVHDASFYRDLWASLTAGQIWRGEFTNRHKDGSLYTEEATIAPVRNASGEITNFIAIKSDVTERRHVEMARRESEATLRLFVHHAPAAIAMLDREMRYLVVSDRWKADYRLGDRDLIGLSHYEVFPEIPENWKEIHRRCLAGAVERCDEDPFPRPDGGREWLRWEIRPWRKADDSIGGIIIFSELITERKHAEAALAESEHRYRQLFERSENALSIQEVIYDENSQPCDFRYVEFNPAFERITGRNRQSIGHTARELAPDIEDYWIQLSGKVAMTGEPASFENFATHMGRYFEGNVYSPRPNQVAVTFMDVTERKHAEEQLHLLNAQLEERVRQRTADLETANRELEAFAHSVSHDLRAPLRGIDGWSLALKEDCGSSLDALGHKYLERVRSEAQRMGRLIDDLLHLSRVGRADMMTGPVDLTALAQTIFTRLKEAESGRLMEFVVAAPMKCQGDARLLEVALTNLLSNAVKFTGPRSPARVEFGTTLVDGRPAYFVRDNGVGFEMAYAKMLFAPFQRLHKTSEFPGTGIGLATVQRVIHRHGGRIWADSKVGEGTTFYFTLGVDKS